MKCKNCHQPIANPRSTTQEVCGMACAIEYSRLKSERKAANDAKQSKKEYRAAKLKAKTRADWMRESQAAFNAFVRARDAREPCISCGRVDVEWTRGGAWDCGHYLSVGSHPELRFSELNAHKQCKKCNGGAGKYAKKNLSVTKSYKEGLILKIGQEKVDWLEGPHEPAKYTIDDLQEIKKLYKLKLKELKCQLA